MKYIKKLSLVLFSLTIVQPAFCMEELEKPRKKTTKKVQNNNSVPSLFELSICALDKNELPSELRRNIEKVAVYLNKVKPSTFHDLTSIINEKLNFRVICGEQNNNLDAMTEDHDHENKEIDVLGNLESFFDLKPVALFLACTQASQTTKKDFYGALSNPRDADELQAQLEKYIFLQMIKGVKTSKDKAYATKILDSKRSKTKESIFIDASYVSPEELDTLLNNHWNNECKKWNKTREKLYNTVNTSIAFSTGFSSQALTFASTGIFIAFLTKVTQNEKIVSKIGGITFNLLCVPSIYLAHKAGKVLQTIINNRIASIHHQDPAIHHNDIAIIPFLSGMGLTWGIAISMCFLDRK